MRYPKTCLFLSLGVLQMTLASVLQNMDLVMQGGDSVDAMDEGEFPVYRNGRCTVRFPRNGNFATKNGFLVGGWDANQNSIRYASDFPGYSYRDMTYRLQKDGNFVAYCGYFLDYATHSHQGSGKDVFMAIDDECILHIFTGGIGCDAMDVEDELWTNVKKQPLLNGERLGQGEYVKFEDGARLVIQSSDGNLVLYNGDDVLWAANNDEAWTSGPSSNMNEYYVHVAHNGHLTLVGRDLTGSNPETVYFDKDLHSNGATCFTVEYDGNDLVAVDCTNRKLKLRGGRI